MLGVTALSGRVFNPDDNRVVGGHPLAVVSDQWWRRRFGAASDVIGRTLLVNGTLVTVVGIAQPGFEGTRRSDGGVEARIGRALR